MNFTQEDRKQVGLFFTKILSTYYNKNPVYYEHIRGHQSKAPDVVRQFILRKCRGEELLNYFRNRKNYFEVEGTNVLLRRKGNVARLDIPSNIKPKVPKPAKFVRSKSESFSSTSSEKLKVPTSSTSSSVKLEHEEYVLKHFTRLLEGKESVDIDSIDFEKLPKKVSHFLTVHCEKSLRNYFEKFGKDLFFVKDKKVTLSKNTIQRSNSCINPVTEVRGENVDSVSIGPEQQKAIAWLMSIEYFHSLLKKAKGNSLHVDKLAGYLNQADDCIKKFVSSHKPMIEFFKLSPALFKVSPMLQISLTKHFNGILNEFKNTIYEPSDESQLDDAELTLMSCLQDLVSHSSLDEDDGCSIESHESKLNVDNESQKSFVHDHSVAEYESEEMERYDSKFYNYDYETDEEYDNHWGNEYDIEPYNEEIDYADCNPSYDENCEDQTCMYEGNDEDLACEDTQNLLLKSSVNETEKTDAGNFTTMEISEQKAIKLKVLFKVQLYCVEVVKNKIFCKRDEVKCVKYFKQYLKAAVGGCTITSLQGSLGQADPEVISFMKKAYKGNKFSSFFEKHDEFIVKSSVVTLASNCNEIFKNRLLSYANYEKEFNYEILYKSSEYGDFLKETIAYVSEVINRLMNNNKLKCSRIYSLVQKFPDFQESLKLNCRTSDEETERFLRTLDIFDISEGLISMQSKSSSISIKWLQELAKNPFCSCYLPIDSTNSNEATYISPMQDIESASSELLCEIANYLIKNKSLCDNVTHYWEVVDIFPSEMLLKIEAAGTDSRIIIEAVEEIGLSFGNPTEIFIYEDQDDFASEISQKNNYLESMNVFHNEAEKAEETGVTSPHVTGNSGDENNQIQSNFMCQENINDEGDSKEDESYMHNKSNDSSLLLDISALKKQQLEQQDNLGSEICDSHEFVVTDVDSSINSPYDEILVNKNSEIPYQDFHNAQSSNTINDEHKEMTLNNLDNFEKHKSCENLHVSGHRNRFSSNSDSDLFESIPSKLSIDKLPCKNEGGYTSDVTDCSENLNDSDFNFLKESDSSCVSDLDETSHDLSEVGVFPMNNLRLESEVNAADPVNNLKNNKYIPLKSKLSVNTEDNFAEEGIPQNGMEGISNLKPKDLDNAGLEKDKCESIENESVKLDVCENGPNDEVSRRCLYPLNSEIKYVPAIMETEARSLAKNFFTNLCSDNVIYVASAKIIFFFERKNFLNFYIASESEATCDTTSESSQKSLSQNLKGLSSNGLSSEIEKQNLCKISKNENKSQDPLQPIEARIILLTSDSCIAQVLSSKQTIYFLKCVFSCNEELCCSGCFDDLKIGDLVSCFVPISELTRKVWIPIMVSKEECQDFNGADQINKVLENQKVDDVYRKCEVGYQLPSKIPPNLESVHVQTEDKIVFNQDCQTELSVSDVYCQTNISGEVARDVASCQTEPFPVVDVQVQVGCDTVSSNCQTEMSYLNATDNETQTDLSGSVKNCMNTEMRFCQTNLSGKIKEVVEVIDEESQTIATGPVFSQQFFHL